MDDPGLVDGWRDLIALHDGHTLSTHGPARCAGRACCIHSPSGHPLRQAPLVWVEEVRTMFRVCPHDRIHPDPDSMVWSGLTYDGWHPCCDAQCCTSFTP